MSSLANSVLKLRSYEIEGACAIRAGALSNHGGTGSPAPVPATWSPQELDQPDAGLEEEADVSAPGPDETTACARALAERAAGEIIAQAREQAEQIIAGADKRVLSMAEEACRKAAARLESQLRTEIAALREQAAREAGEIVAKAQSERQVMLASAQREVIELAIELARRVVARELRVSPDVVLSVAAETLGHLPSGTEAARILVNPADFDLVRAERDRLAGLSSGLVALEAQPDPSVGRGGCVVQSPGGDVDGRLNTRFEQLENALLKRDPTLEIPAAPAGGGGWR